MIVSLTAGQRRSARWVGTLFLLIVALQRFSLPGQVVSILVVVVPLWAAAGVACGILEFDRTRLQAWLGMVVATATAILLQSKIVPNVQISILAWSLFIVVWLPFTIRLVERGTGVYLAMLRYVVWICAALAALAVFMVAIQLVGVGYKDYFRLAVPQSLQLNGFVITYPIAYGSTIYKANAFIGLEPSTISAQLGLGLLAAPFVRARVWTMVTLILGLVLTVSGSGILLFAVGLVIILLRRSRRLVRRYAVIAFVAVGVVALAPIGQLLLSRSTEFQSTNSSTSLRATRPYEVLLPQWLAHPSGVLLGYGPGSAQRAVTDSNIVGLIVPTPAKVFFEYGLLAGLSLAAFMLICYWGSPSNAMAISLLFSLWVLQPGTTASVIVAPVLALVSLWSPRAGPAVESLRHVEFASDVSSSADAGPRPFVGSVSG